MKSQVQEHLQKLSPKEQTDFVVWLESPALLNSAGLAQLARQLMGIDLVAQPSNNGLKGRKKPEIPEHGSRSYQYLRSNQLQSLLMEFLAWKRLRKHDALMQLLSLEELHERRWDFLFERQQAKVEKVLDSELEGGAEFHFLQLKKLEVVDLHHDFAPQKWARPRFQKMLEQADLAYFTLKMELICRAKSQDIIDGDQHHTISFEKELLDQIQAFDLESKPLLKALCLLNELLESRNPKTYANLRQHLAALSAQQLVTAKPVWADIYVAIINLLHFSKERIVDNRDEAILNLYLEQFDNKVLLQDERVSHRHYLNVITIALRQGRPHTAASRADEFRYRLIQPFGGAVHALAKAKILLWHNQKEEALDLVSRVLSKLGDIEDASLKLELLFIKLSLLYGECDYRAAVQVAKTMGNFAQEGKVSKKMELAAWKTFSLLALGVLEICLMPPTPKKEGRLQKLKAAFDENLANAMHQKWLRMALDEIS
jgi:hypothetical protein